MTLIGNLLRRLIRLVVSSSLSQPHCVWHYIVSLLSDREGRTVGRTKRHPSRYRLHGLEISTAIAPVAAGIDKRHRFLDQFHDRDISRRADLQGTKLRHPIDQFGRVNGRIATT
jgi:hypothetical protein